jgi:hypothetical protein
MNSYIVYVLLTLLAGLHKPKPEWFHVGLILKGEERIVFLIDRFRLLSTKISSGDS